MRWLKALFRRPILCRGIVLRQGRDDLWRWRCVYLRPGDSERFRLMRERSRSLWVDAIGDGWRSREDAMAQAYLCLFPLCDPLRLPWWTETPGESLVRMTLDPETKRAVRLHPPPIPVEAE